MNGSEQDKCLCGKRTAAECSQGWTPGCVGANSTHDVKCRCGVRAASACPGAWEQGCDLGANPDHVAVHQETPEEAAAMDEALGIEREEPGFVRMPRTAAEAECMAKLGLMWLEVNAPDRVKPHPEGLLQDASRPLFDALAADPNARQHARDAAEAIQAAAPEREQNAGAIAKIRKALEFRRYREASETEDLLRMAASILVDDGLLIERLKQATPAPQAQSINTPELIALLKDADKVLTKFNPDRGSVAWDWAVMDRVTAMVDKLEAMPAPAALSGSDIEGIAHRTAWRFKKSSDPAHSDTYTFNRATLLEFVRRLGAAQ